VLSHRVLAALVFAPALFGLIWLGGVALGVTVLFIAWLMLWEFLEMTLGPGESYSKLCGFFLVTVVTLAVLGWWPSHVVAVVVPASVVGLLVAMMLRPIPMERTMIRAGFVSVGVLYSAGLLPFMAVLRENQELGLGLALAALFCTWGADTGAYFVGKAIGRHKLYPRVSPGKTIEGAFGGVAASAGVAFLVRWLFSLDLGQFDVIAIGTLAAVFGLLGDLCESMIKRSVGAKDSSNLIPGHGGVLDRFDGVMFAAPAIWAYAEIFATSA